MAGYLPTRQSELLDFAQNMDTLLTAAPQEYGIDALQSSELHDLYVAFKAAYDKTLDGATRSPASIEAKDTAKAAYVAELRRMVRVMQAWPTMTNEKRAQLRITIPDVEPTPAPVPDTPPQLDVSSVQGRTVFLRLRDSETGERRKPEGVQGATVLTYVGEAVPEGIDGWTFQGNVTRLDTSVTFGTTVPAGTKVWVTAFWYNRRGESGPACSPMFSYVGFGGLSKAA